MEEGSKIHQFNDRGQQGMSNFKGTGTRGFGRICKAGSRGVFMDGIRKNGIEMFEMRQMNPIWNFPEPNHNRGNGYHGIGPCHLSWRGRIG